MGKKARILVVEDEAIVAEDLEMAITTIGYEVVGCAASATDAVKKALELKPDLVLMDIVLRGKKSGIDASYEIKEKGDIPIIFLTAYSDIGLIERAKGIEPYAYLVKPFLERQLHASIEMALYKSRMEKKLKSSEEWLSTTLASIGDAVIATDSNGYVKFMNPVAQSLTGWMQEDAGGKKLEDVLHIVNADTGRQIENLVNRVIHDGMVVGLANHTVLIAKDGREIPIDDCGAPIRDGKGKSMGVVMVFRDVSERRKAEEELRGSVERYYTLFNGINDAVFVHGLTAEDLPGTFIEVNDVACQKLGCTREELLTLSYLDIIAPEQLGNVLTIKENLLAEKHSLLETVAVTRDGRKIPLEINAQLFNLNGQPTVLSIARDVTERKEAEKERVSLMKELEAKNTELERFTYSVSHDLRAPLFSIRGFIAILREDVEQGERERVESDLKYIEKGAAKMEHLLDDTLQLSRIGRVANPPEDVPFGELVLEALEQTTQRIQTSGIEVSLADAFPSVHVDRMRIVEVLVNLIENGINYRGEQSHPKIDIGHRRDNDETVFYVRDNGTGIDKSEHEKVFLLFYQIEKKDNKGTGAGLTIVKRIIEVHGGRIWIESERGKGCTVCFTLPLA
jgi:PAS domain S-box-containing protein